MVLDFFYFHPYLGKVSNLTNSFHMGWNHQLVKGFSRKTRWVSWFVRYGICFLVIGPAQGEKQQISHAWDLGMLTTNVHKNTHTRNIIHDHYTMAYNFQGMGIYTTEQPLCPSDILKEVGSVNHVKISIAPRSKLPSLSFEAAWFLGSLDRDTNRDRWICWDGSDFTASNCYALPFFFLDAAEVVHGKQRPNLKVSFVVFENDTT